MDTLEQTAKDLARLELQLNSLLEQCRKLREENHSLLNRQETLVSDRASLVAKNEEARTKVEAMINRLKSLEQSCPQSPNSYLTSISGWNIHEQPNRTCIDHYSRP